MGQTRRACTREFTQEAVQRVTAGGHPTAPVARDLGITPNLLRRWTHEVAGEPVAAFPSQGRRKPHDEELARLKRDWARVTQERELFQPCGGVLRHAVGMRCQASRAHTGRVPVRRMCRILAVSPSGDSMRGWPGPRVAARQRIDGWSPRFG